MGGLKRKTTTIILVIITLLCLAIGGYGYYLSYIGSTNNTSDEEIKDFFTDGTLYFYDDKTLLGTYECVNKEGYCGYAYEYIDDNVQGLDFYNDDKIDNLSLISNKYAFIADTNDETPYRYADGVILYDVVNERKIATYKYVKNYTVGIENNYFIVQSEDGSWGVIQLGEVASIKIAFGYDFIGLQNQVTDGLLDANLVAVQKGNEYFLIDMNNAILTNKYTRKIASYNGKNVILYDNEFYYYYDYEGNDLFPSTGYKHLSFTGKYLNIIDLDNNFYVYDGVYSSAISSVYQITDTDIISSKVLENGNVEVYINDELKETINV